MTDLRTTKRLAGMRRAQTTAIDLFAERGFDGVTVEQVAERARVSPVSIYRWFGTKENLVLWDDYDPALFRRIAEHVVEMAPLAAVRTALIEQLDRMYDTDRGLILDRTKMAIREPALRRAVADNRHQMAGALTGLLNTDRNRLGASVLAAAVVGALEAIVTEWAERDGRVPLGELIDEGFQALEEASWTAQ